MNLGTAQIIQGNALNLPLPDASVDLICTSPPYFGLRSYQDAGQHYDGQIGSEATPAEFLDALLAATREMMRVLKPSGSIFVNLGDKYAAGHGGSSTMRNGGYGANLTKAVWEPSDSDGSGSGYGKGHQSTSPRLVVPGLRPKSLMGIPWRYAINCIDQLGLILRAEIIWSKPNGLPESVTDRVRRSHEQWFHFVKQPRYFSATDEIREPQLFTGGDNKNPRISGNGVRHRDYGGAKSEYNPLGKLPGSVWVVPTQPLTVPPELGVDHFAAYPMEWPRRIIQGWTPNGICVECGEGRRPTVTKELAVIHQQNRTRVAKMDMRDKSGQIWDDSGVRGLTATVGSTQATITGYVCGCPERPLPLAYTTGISPEMTWEPPPTTPAVVLDPFGGTGTTALVAKALGRTGITVDLSSDYCRLAEWRCNDPRELAAALQVEKPEPVHPDQLDLFSESP